MGSCAFDKEATGPASVDGRWTMPKEFGECNVRYVAILLCALHMQNVRTGMKGVLLAVRLRREPYADSEGSGSIRHVWWIRDSLSVVRGGGRGYGACKSVR